MATPRRRFIPELLDTHAEDLAFLWSQRREALTSRLYTLREFGDLSGRLEAHLQGLMVAPADALLERFRTQLAAPDRDEVFAAAYTLLRLAQAASTHKVVAEFSRAAAPTLAGLRDALSLAPPALFAAEMQSALAQAKPATAAAAAVVLANHRLLEAGSSRLAALVQQDDPAVCALAWRAAASVDALHVAQQARGTAVTRPLREGLAHADAGVRRATLLAAAWSGQTSVLPHLRQRAAEGETVALEGLVILGGADEAELVKQAVLAMPEATARCALLARYGHPMALNALLRWMDPELPAVAAAAGEAFTRITGHDVRGERRTLPVADGADEFEREMAPDVWLPDAAKARALLERQGEEWARGARWCNGHRLDGEFARERLPQLDLEARWDAGARAALAGRPLCPPPPIH